MLGKIVATAPIRLNRAVLRDALLFSLLCFLASLPHLFSQLYGQADLPPLLQQKLTSLTTDIRLFLAQQFLLLFFLLFICALLAATFRDRYRLPDLSWALLKSNLRDKSLHYTLPLFVVILPFFFWFSFTFYENRVMQLIPSLYPSQPQAALYKALMNAFTLETIGRLGLLTIGCGIFRHKLVANLGVSTFFAFLLLNTIRRYGMLSELGSIIWLPLISIFLVNFALNLLYLRKGIFICMLAQFLLNLKFLAYALR